MLQKIASFVDGLLFSSFKATGSVCLNRFFKLAWTVTVVVFFSGLVFYSHQAYRKWHIQPDIAVDVKPFLSRNIPFPAVTVCQPTYAANIDMDNINPNSFLENAVTGLPPKVQNFLPLLVQICKPKFARVAHEKVCTNRSEKDFITVLTNATYFFFFYDCHFGATQHFCNQVLTPTITEFGACYTFNMLSYNTVFTRAMSSRISALSKLVIRNSDRATWTLEGGFSSNADSTLPFRGVQSNIFKTAFTLLNRPHWFCDAIGRGLKLIVHMPNEIATPFHQQYFIPLRYERQFRISAIVRRTSEDMRKYPPETRRCYFQSERRLRFFRSYTKALCDFECLTNYTLHQCGCVKFNMPHSQFTNICDLDKVECYENIASVWTSDCNCLASCTDIEYRFEVASESSVMRMAFVDTGDDLINGTETPFKASFGALAVEEHTRYVLYTAQHFVADCGGLIGLFLGFSLLSIYELAVDAIRTLFQITNQNPLIKNFLRVTWIFAVCLASCGFVFYASISFWKWQIAPDISTRVEQVTASNIPLPAMTICHPFFPNELGALDPMAIFDPENYEALEPVPLSALSVDEQSFLALTTQTCFPEFAKVASEKICVNRSKIDIVKMLMESTYSLDFAICIFRDVRTKNCSQILRKTLTEHGICSTFNLQSYASLFNDATLAEDFDIYRDQRQISRFPFTFSPLYTLTVTEDEQNLWSLEHGYNTTDDEVLPIRASNENTVGILMTHNTYNIICEHKGYTIKLFFHLPSDLPSSLHESKFVQMGREKRFAVDAVMQTMSEQMRGYSIDVRRCYYNEEKKLKFFRSYTKANCDFECLTNYTLRECGCVKFSMLRDSVTKVCDLDRVQCYQAIADAWPIINSSDVSEECKCLKFCTNIEYIVKEEREGYVHGLSVDATYITMKFSARTIENHVSFVAYSVQNFIADCGGLIGLFLGLSLLSIYELLHKIVMEGVKLRKQRVGDQKEDLERLPTSRRAQHFLVIFKVAAVLLSFCGLLFYTYAAYRKWHIAPDISIAVRAVPARDIPMPAVTICSTLYPTQIQFKDIGAQEMMNSVLIEKAPYELSSVEQNHLAVLMQTCCSKKFVTGTRMLCPARTETNIVRLLREAESQSLYSQCTFRDITRECEEILRPTLAEHGLCQTLNMQSNAEIFTEAVSSEDFEDFRASNVFVWPSNHSIERKSSQWTLEGGYENAGDSIFPIRAMKTNSFEITQFIERWKASRACTNLGLGYMLFLHMPNEVPTLFHKIHFVQLEVFADLKISAIVRRTSEDMRKYPPETRRCYYQSERRLMFFRSYTKALCDFECMTNYTLLQCGCVKFNMPRSKFTRVCDLDTVECMLDAIVNWTKTPDPENGCECLPACTEIDFFVSLDHESEVKNDTNLETLFKLTFAKHTVKEQMRYIAYTVQNFVADCGGLIGLFLGFSLLSIFELVCNVIARGVRWREGTEKRSSNRVAWGEGK